MHKIQNPDQNTVVGWTSIRALQHRGVTSTSNKEDSSLHCYVSLGQLMAFVLLRPQRPRTYHNGTLPLLPASALVYCDIWVAHITTLSLSPAFRLEDRVNGNIILG